MIPKTKVHSNQSETGILQGGFGRNYMVQTGSGVSRASLAFSCLVVPEAGDKVLLQRVDNQLFILAILERTQQCETRLVAQGDVSLSSTDGSVGIRASQDVSLSSAGRLSVVGKDIDVASLSTLIHSQKLDLKGDRLTSQWREINTIAEAIHLIAGTLTERFKNAFRKVDGTSHQASRNQLQQVDETLSIRSKHAAITSRKDMKIDGERIHMG